MKCPPGRKAGGATPEVPSSLEWNFSSCPPEELSSCQSYEYSRSSTLIRATVARLRAGEDDPLTGAVFLVFPLPLALWLPKSDWWPDTPYLAIPIEARNKLASVFRPKTKQTIESLASLVDPFADGRLPYTGVIAVYVPPNQPLRKLERAFGDLLRRNYPDLLVRSNRFRRAHDSDQMMDNLKFLSAWRLAQDGYTAKQAIALAKKHGVETYNNVWAYRRAKAKAQKIILALEDSLLGLANCTAKK